MSFALGVLVGAVATFLTQVVGAGVTTIVLEHRLRKQAWL